MYYKNMYVYWYMTSCSCCSLPSTPTEPDPEQDTTETEPKLIPLMEVSMHVQCTYMLHVHVCGWIQLWESDTDMCVQAFTLVVSFMRHILCVHML